MLKTGSLGIVGATGAAGSKILEILQEENIKPSDLRLFASEKSAGKQITFADKIYEVENLQTADFKGLNTIFFAAGSSISKDYALKAVSCGAAVIDNSSAYRADPKVPLVVPEINFNEVNASTRLIANPNCSTIQLVMAIAPLHRINPVKRLVVTTMQSVSGTGFKGVEELKKQVSQTLKGIYPEPEIYPHVIAFNLIPEIDAFNPETDMFKEEEKIIFETNKILASDIKISATAVRVPVYSSHSESVNLQFEKPFSADEARYVLSNAEGISVIDAPRNSLYPTPLDCAGSNKVFVGRIRDDLSAPNSLNMWVVSDNLRKGAAWNAVQIYMRLISSGYTS